ncbi:MAG: M48 family metallopeptidase [Burkholderiales bacterium]|nr:M48 family metallopeptidase [Burkholderiales bacterium]
MNESAEFELAHAARGCGCARHGRRLFSTLLAAAAPMAALAAAMPECRRSVASNLVPAATVENSAQQQYVALLREASGQHALASADNAQLQRLRYIAERMIPFTAECNERARQWRWEVNLLGSRQLNAFCMPGGKIAFFSGILSQLQLSDDEVAIIMGHEISHALLEHARERMAKGAGTQLLLRGGAALLGLGQAGDIAAQYGSQFLALKFSRDDESQADALGLVLTARSGYDPRAGVSLWRKMEAATRGKAPPQWLSTHPAGPTRIKDIEARLPAVLPLFEAAPRPARHFAPPPRA